MDGHDVNQLEVVAKEWSVYKVYIRIYKFRVFVIGPSIIIQQLRCNKMQFHTSWQR